MFQYPDLGYICIRTTYKQNFINNTAALQGERTGTPGLSPASGLRYLRRISVRTAVHLLYLLPIPEMTLIRMPSLIRDPGDDTSTRIV